MAGLADLYRDVILDHYKNPRNLRKLDHSNRQAHGFNSLCGDKYLVYLQLDCGVIRDISFEGTGCAISMASASMMTEALKRKTEQEARTILDRFLHLLDRSAAFPAGVEILGPLIVFSSVRDYPVRAKCAILPWHTLRNALEQNSETAAIEKG